MVVFSNLVRSVVGCHCTVAVAGVLRQIYTVEADQHPRLWSEGDLELRR